jgi:hypothetical protein
MARGLRDGCCCFSFHSKEEEAIPLRYNKCKLKNLRATILGRGEKDTVVRNE